MRILALIAARGGSKRLPGKNVKLLGGKPLILWSLDAARDIAFIQNILVSTDDPSIAKLCLSRLPASVPWLRPSELATDQASSVDVALHALDWYESQNGAVDGLLLLQPTSPFRSKKTINEGIELFRESGRRSILAVSKIEQASNGYYKLDGDRLTKRSLDIGSESSSSIALDKYRPNGALYLISPEELRLNKSFVSENTIPLIIESLDEGLDIDTAQDWEAAENYIKRFSKNRTNYGLIADKESY